MKKRVLSFITGLSALLLIITMNPVIAFQSDGDTDNENLKIVINSNMSREELNNLRNELKEERGMTLELHEVIRNERGEITALAGAVSDERGRLGTFRSGEEPFRAVVIKRKKKGGGLRTTIKVK